MTDSISKERRSWNMSRIKAKNTGPELIVRSLLHSMGYRFRLNRKDLPGKPDIVLPKYKTVIFVHGCFWHMHKGCKDATIPKTRTDWWKEKLISNVKRDKRNLKLLETLKWKTIIIWECEIANRNKEFLIKKIIKKLENEFHYKKY